MLQIMQQEVNDSVGLGGLEGKQNCILLHSLNGFDA